MSLFIFVPNALGQMMNLDQIEELKELERIKEQESIIETTSNSEYQDSSNLNQDEILTKESSENYNESFGYDGALDFLGAPRKKYIERQLEYFGYDYFVNPPTTYAERSDMPIPAEYIVSPGDEVEIILFGNKSSKFSIKVSREGDIFFPEIGPITVSGLTYTEFKEKIKAIVSNQMIGTEVSVTLGAIGSMNIFVLGEAAKPGMYTISSLSTLTNAIFTSGGVKPSGSLRKIELKRMGNTILEFDFYDVLLNGDISNDIALKPNDVIFIPPVAKAVAVDGEVNRPAIYELKDNETISNAIKFAGNMKSKADINSIELQKIDFENNGFNLLKIDMGNDDTADLILDDGDVLTIFPVIDIMRNAILLKGHTQKPGFQPWTEGMKLLDVIQDSTELLADTDLHYVIVLRRGKNGQRSSVFQANLKELFLNPRSGENLTLEDQDEITFLPTILDEELINTEYLEGDFNIAGKFQGSLYVLKTIDEEQEREESKIASANSVNTAETESLQKKYYKYTVYNYCDLPIDALESNYLRKTDIVDDSNIIDLNESSVSYQLISPYELTEICRRQLIDPIVEILTREGVSGSPKKTLQIIGNVKYPGRYPIADNGNLAKAIDSAGGLDESSFVNEISISRRDIDNKQMFTRNLQKNLSIAGNESIKPLDVITVKAFDRKIESVSIMGEVYFPGIYPIQPDDTILEVINRAGGLKPTASLKNSVFQRQSVRELDQMRIKKIQEDIRREILLLRNTSSYGEESVIDISTIDALLDESENLDSVNLGRIVLDFDSIMEQKSEDMLLEDNDQITIARETSTISVFGEVYSSTTHKYDSSLSINDYLSLSGGITDFADEQNIYLIKSDGSIMTVSSGQGFFRSNNQIESGDAIIVPLKVGRFSSIKAATELTQIIYQISLAAAAINSFSN